MVPSKAMPSDFPKGLPITGSTSSQCCYPEHQICNSQMARDRCKPYLNHSSSLRLCKTNTINDTLSRHRQTTGEKKARQGDIYKVASENSQITYQGYGDLADLFLLFSYWVCMLVCMCVCVCVQLCVCGCFCVCVDAKGQC